MPNWRDYFKGADHRSLYAKHAEPPMRSVHGAAFADLHTERSATPKEPRTPLAPGASAQPQIASLESILKGQVIELWSTAAGRIFLVADEEDARAAMDRYGARRGEAYSASEARSLVAVDDPAVVAEIHEYKRLFDAKVHYCDNGLKGKLDE